MIRYYYYIILKFRNIELILNLIELTPPPPFRYRMLDLKLEYAFYKEKTQGSF